jgi:arylformamidase
MNLDHIEALGKYRIIDISQPVSETTACFPGDTPFSLKVKVSYESSHVLNLSAITMSPHVGTHADAPVHVRGTMDGAQGVTAESIGTVPLEPFVGPATVIDLSPHRGAIERTDVEKILSERKIPPSRVLFKTLTKIRYHVFENAYAFLTPDLIDLLADSGVCLIGLDTPSVDHIDSKGLESHHKLLERKISWLENLDLTEAYGKDYFLMALPIKLMQAEAAPVRAVLLD